MDGEAIHLELAVDADVVLAEGAGAEDGDLQYRRQGARLARCSLVLHGSEAAAVEFE